MFDPALSGRTHVFVLLRIIIGVIHGLTVVRSDVSGATSIFIADRYLYNYIHVNSKAHAKGTQRTRTKVGLQKGLT